RILFPDKSSLPSDTETAVRYSGIGFDAGNNAELTSISLGYVAELYVDFGYVGIVIGTFLLGCLFGYCVKRVFSFRSLPALVNSGLAVMLMLTFSSYEQALLKMIGGFLMTLIVIVGLQRYLLPRILNIFGSMRRPAGAMYRPRSRTTA